MNAQTDASSYDVFISYSRKDREIAGRIHEALRQRNLSVFRDVTGIPAGAGFVTAIERALESSRAVLFLISPHVLNSGWVEEERSYALVLSHQADRPVPLVLIPLLIGDAYPPGFLKSRNFVDFRSGDFEHNIEALVAMIQGGEAPSVKAGGLPPELAFLGFFQEGLLPPFYDALISGKKLNALARKVERQGIVHRVQARGVEMVGLDPKYIGGALEDLPNPSEAARDALFLLLDFIHQEAPFHGAGQWKVGRGRAILLRDLLELAKRLDDDEGSGLRGKVVALARRFLPLIIEEDEVRLAMEISRELRAVEFLSRPSDDVLHARLLLRIGEAKTALNLFEVYRGDKLFDERELTPAERLVAALDWAKAAKESGGGRDMHEKLVAGYEEMLNLADEIERETQADCRAVKAEVFNNRATQLAVYGGKKGWPQALADLDQATRLYKELGKRRQLLAVRANFVAHSLDRLAGGAAPPPELSESLAQVDSIADDEVYDEPLFFFLYQKAKLLRRQQSPEATKLYEAAAEVAQKCHLEHRAAIARLWVLRLQKSAGKIAEADYLEEAKQCAEALRRHADDAWSANALRKGLIDLAQVHHTRKEVQQAWQYAVEAFDREVPGLTKVASDALPESIRPLLGLLVTVDAGVPAQNDFLEKHGTLLKKWMHQPAYAILKWRELVEWTNKN